ncbi:MAG TPA: hypothetical protein VLT35_00720 [Methanocella sp.]|nr:hypothetical protein [Methanocella sp.]
MKHAVRAIVLRAGLTMGVILAVAELAFGVALFFLRPAMNDFISAGEQDVVTLMPLIIAWFAFLFLLLAIYFACGMMVAKWLAPLPLRSRDIAIYGAVGGAIAELARSVIAVAVDFAISYVSPLASVRSADTLNVALANAGIRLACGLPAFLVLAAVVAGLSAWLFSIIFFRSDSPTE